VSWCRQATGHGCRWTDLSGLLLIGNHWQRSVRFQNHCQGHLQPVLRILYARVGVHCFHLGRIQHQRWRRVLLQEGRANSSRWQLELDLRHIGHGRFWRSTTHWIWIWIGVNRRNSQHIARAVAYSSFQLCGRFAPSRPSWKSLQHLL
jgi:hypothetical protein